MQAPPLFQRSTSTVPAPRVPVQVATNVEGGLPCYHADKAGPVHHLLVLATARPSHVMRPLGDEALLYIVEHGWCCHCAVNAAMNVYAAEAGMNEFAGVMKTLGMDSGPARYVWRMMYADRLRDE